MQRANYQTVRQVQQVVRCRDTQMPGLRSVHWLLDEQRRTCVTPWHACHERCPCKAVVVQRHDAKDVGHALGLVAGQGGLQGAVRVVHSARVHGQSARCTTDHQIQHSLPRHNQPWITRTERKSNRVPPKSVVGRIWATGQPAGSSGAGSSGGKSWAGGRHRGERDGYCAQSAPGEPQDSIHRHPA